MYTLRPPPMYELKHLSVKNTYSDPEKDGWHKEAKIVTYEESDVRILFSQNNEETTNEMLKILDLEIELIYLCSELDTIIEDFNKKKYSIFNFFSYKVEKNIKKLAIVTTIGLLSIYSLVALSFVHDVFNVGWFVHAIVLFCINMSLFLTLYLTPLYKLVVPDKEIRSKIGKITKKVKLYNKLIKRVNDKCSFSNDGYYLALFKHKNRSFEYGCVKIFYLNNSSWCEKFKYLNQLKYNIVLNEFDRLQESNYVEKVIYGK